MRRFSRFAKVAYTRRNWRTYLPGGFFIFLLLLSQSPANEAQEKKDDRITTELLYKGDTVTIQSVEQKWFSETRYRAMGNVRISYKDIVMVGDEVEYNRDTGQGHVSGHVRFTRKEEWLICSRADFDFNTETGTFYDASGFTDRQFSITGGTIRKTGPETYEFETGTATTCREKQPKWSFAASKASIRLDGSAQMRNAVFKIKGVPVLYTPYILFPMEKKKRSSGFVPFHTGTSTSKGRVFSEGYYQTLGQSADLFIYGDYFSKRGLAIGSMFRIRPNQVTHFTLDVYGINDTDAKDQGGVRLIVDGESLLRDNWRAVARVNITSNFSFRQVFADSFRSATVSHERAIGFLTRNHNGFSTNIAYAREETYFPAHPLVIRKIPSLEFVSLGTPLGKSPLIFSFRSSLDSMSRMDSTIETQHMIQRLDIYPRLTIRLPSLAGFSLLPSVGVRETYYGAQLTQDPQPRVVNQSLHRHYADLDIDLRTPVLEREFSSSWFGNFRHVIEPLVTYRYTHGITDLDRTIRFDEEDAIADTNEVEYGIMNRFFRKRATDTDAYEKYEFMSLGLFQKYYFDPTFGGAFREGRSNTFYPLDTLTGFYQTAEMSNLAPVSMVFRLSPRNGIHNDFRADFDVRRQRWRNESLSTIWNQGNISLSGTYFRIHALDETSADANHIQGQIGYGS